MYKDITKVSRALSRFWQAFTTHASDVRFPGGESAYAFEYNKEKDEWRFSS